MSNYVDGFVFPIPRESLEAYRQLSEAVAAIWKEYGAIEYREFIGDDFTLVGPRSFSELANEDEVVIFGWAMFESREVRDNANQGVPADPRMAALMDNADAGFDPARMIYGGFSAFVES